MKSMYMFLKGLFLKYAIGITFKIFSREVKIEGLPNKVKIFPIVWKGKLHLLGLNGDVDSTSLEFTDAHTVRFINASELPLNPSYPMEISSPRSKVAHVILSHLPKL